MTVGVCFNAGSGVGEGVGEGLGGIVSFVEGEGMGVGGVAGGVGEAVPDPDPDESPPVSDPKSEPSEDEKGNKKVTERRVVLYFYVKENPFTSGSNFTMIRVSALAPLEGSYDGILNITREFMGDTLPYMFELQKKEPLVLFILLASHAGKVVVGLLFLAPLVIIFYPQIRKIKMLERFQSFFG